LHAVSRRVWKGSGAEISRAGERRQGDRGEADLIAEPQHLKAGDSHAIPAGVVHDAKVDGGKALKVLAVYVVDNARLLASPAP
jgi:hypothetical protein